MLGDFIDRPPQETKEDWLARQAGLPTPGLVNSRGETYDQWVSRHTTELAKMLAMKPASLTALPIVHPIYSTLLPNMRLSP